MRGPETKATPADCLAEDEWLGIRFKLGTFMPRFTPGDLKDRRDVSLPGATSALVFAPVLAVGGAAIGMAAMTFENFRERRNKL
jgi:hypothetical protein